MSKCRVRVRTGVCALVLAGLAGLAQAAFKEVAYIELDGAEIPAARPSCGVSP